MNRKGICYDVGAVMPFNWRPHFDRKEVHREIEIIKTDLHCNAIKISALSIDRLKTTAEDALEQGLEVWLSPLMWDKTPEQTLAYITKAAVAAESLRQNHGDKLVFIVGGELTLFMQGILPGKNFTRRLRDPSFSLACQIWSAQ